MKKVFLTLTLIATLCGAMAQQTKAPLTKPTSSIEIGKEMFISENYVGAERILTQFLAKNDDIFAREDAEYMIAVSRYHLNDENKIEILKSFLKQHPETAHRHQLQFLIGSCYFENGDWEEARNHFRLADLDYLSLKEQEDYSFRLAYAEMKLGNNQEASRLFNLLEQNSRTYREAAQFYAGHIQYIEGNYDEALRRLSPLATHPEYAEQVAFYTTQSTFFKGDLKRAASLAENFLNHYAGSERLTEIYRILGNTHYRMGNTAKAISFYRNYFAQTQTPLRGDAYFMGLSYFDNAQYREAARMFQYATNGDGELRQNAQLFLGQTYLKLGEKQKAQMAFEAATRDRFDDKARQTAMFNYALLAHETNFSVFSESITLFENFLKEYPQSPYTDQVNDILAETFLTTKDYDAALAAIERINRPGRRILEAKQMILFQLGAQQFINGNINQAIPLFDRSISMGDYDAKARNNAYYWRGESFFRNRNYTQAANDFVAFTRNAYPTDENYALGWYNLGYSYFKQQQYAESTSAFQKYISLEKDRSRSEFADAYNRIGDSHYFRRHFAEAQQYYTQAATANSAAADYAVFQRAFVLGLQRNFQGKIDVLDELMHRYPNSQYIDDALYEKSRALTVLNRENEAIAVLQKLLQNYPRSPLAGQGGVQLGQLYFNMGQHQQSISAYKNVIRNFPGSDDARTALASLETVYRDMNDVQSYVDYANALPGGMRITPNRQDSLTYLAAEGIYMKGAKKEAQTALSRYLQSYPNGAYSSDASYYLGVLYQEKGDKTTALSYFRKVIDANSAKYQENALQYVAQTESEKGNFQQALADYAKLANVARSAAHKQVGLMGLVRLHIHLQQPHEAIKAATALLDETNLAPDARLEATYMRAKAYKQLNETNRAIADLKAIASETRSKYGAEAQFLLAETYFHQSAYDKAEAQVKEFMQKGTPHAYWMARSLIVLSDTYAAKGDTFQARQYLESLQANYKGDNADIRQMIQECLKKLQHN